MTNHSEAAANALIRADNLVAGYFTGVNILNGCDLYANRGELVGIIGPILSRTAIPAATISEKNKLIGLSIDLTSQKQNIKKIQLNKILKNKFNVIYINNLEQELSVSFSTRPKAEIDDLVAFFESLGGVSKFKFTLEDSNEGSNEEAIKCICSTWSQTWSYANFYSLSCTFKRVYEA